MLLRLSLYTAFCRLAASKRGDVEYRERRLGERGHGERRLGERGHGEKWEKEGGGG